MALADQAQALTASSPESTLDPHQASLDREAGRLQAAIDAGASELVVTRAKVGLLWAEKALAQERRPEGGRPMSTIVEELLVMQQKVLSLQQAGERQALPS